MMDSKQHSRAEDEVLVRVEGVSKKFCRSLKRSLWYGLCDIAGELSPFGRNPQPGSREAEDGDLRDGEFYAVRDVSFQLRRGECLGIIGHNGAGKTTLLKILNGLIKPDTGRIEMNGRVGALIALGAGFNPILTGRENIYINGAVLGLRKAEVEQKIDEIIEFAEIREFIDMPVQSYSSGMAVRLGFSVASALRPDVLILDEVLAVGDIRFVVKCLNRLRSLVSRAAVILVSHNMQAVSGICSRVLLMDHGTVVADSPEPSRAIDLYHAAIEPAVTTAGTGGVDILGSQLEGEALQRDRDKAVYPQGTPGALLVAFEVRPGFGVAELQVNITDESGVPVVAVPVLDHNGAVRLFPEGKHELAIAFGSLELNAGSYCCTAVFRSPPDSRVLNRTEGLSAFLVSAPRSYGARIVRPFSPGPVAGDGQPESKLSPKPTGYLFP